ncbi:probable pectinesterase/pectinesterase inhibitor 61 [Nymphaea colorata]|uniref:probable pectinesterase/pectinesterase inhibitor 61 n=1 Tax=Nymphaea colorata TaxID=210225 RepID=UPI00129EAAD6|nr:probable pectinesterase/pectinesterase inhibitor 61 [Nymphaea colorata]
MSSLLLLFLSSLLFLQGTHGLCVPRPHHFKAKQTVQPPASVAPPPPVNAFVVALCKNSSYPDECVSAVRPYLPENGEVGAKEMLIMHVNASRSRLSQANAKADEVLRDTTISPEVRTCVETCKENYDDSSSNLDAALDAMAKSDGATLNVMLSAAMTDVETCDDGFDEFPGLISPLSRHDLELQHLMSNCLYFGTIL